MSFFSELKRRNVVRMAVLYIVAAWVVLQIADVLFDPLGLPQWTFRLVLGLLLLGFPFALIFAWVFEMTPEGLKRERDLDRGASVVAHTARKMNALIVVLLLVAIAGLAANRFMPARNESAPVAAQANAPGQPAAGAASPAQPPGDPSIAVLPFVNMSGDAENEYFSDGLTEELLNTLVRVGGLKVTGRTSSFVFKGRSLDLREVGRLLNVANVLEGSVRKTGNRVRITAQLVKTSDGYHLWSDTFDRELDDIFAIQQQIADQVTEALHVTLLGPTGAGEPLVTPAGRNPQAYEEYLRGTYIWQRNPDDLESLNMARAHFEQALAIDPQSSDALWGMFQVWDRMNRNGHVPFADSIAEMQSYAEKLEKAAPGVDHALITLGRMASLNRDYRLSRDYLRQAATRYPGSATVQTHYALSLADLREYDQATEAIDRAARLDPLSLDVMRHQAHILHRKGDCRGVEEVTQRALEIEPDVGRVRSYLALCIYETTGDAARALPYAEAEPVGFLRGTGLAILHHALGDRKRAREELERMIAAYGDSASYQYGQINSQWGEYDTALAWLEKALAIRDPGIIEVDDDPLLDPLRDQPRFRQILIQAGHGPD